RGHGVVELGSVSHAGKTGRPPRRAATPDAAGVPPHHGAPASALQGLCRGARMPAARRRAGRGRGAGARRPTRGRGGPAHPGADLVRSGAPRRGSAAGPPSRGGGAAGAGRRARERFEAAGPPDEMARVLNEQGRLDAQLGRYTAASAAYREALAWAQRAPRDARLELSIRLNLAELDLEAGRLLEAEAELRR